MKLSIVDQSPVSTGHTAAEALRNTIELARLADELGYYRYWIAEHHATAAFASPAPEILIARVAAETSSIRIGSGGVMLPHGIFNGRCSWNPLRRLLPGLGALHGGTGGLESVHRSRGGRNR